MACCCGIQWSSYRCSRRWRQVNWKFLLGHERDLNPGRDLWLSRISEDRKTVYFQLSDPFFFTSLILRNHDTSVFRWTLFSLERNITKFCSNRQLCDLQRVTTNQMVHKSPALLLISWIDFLAVWLERPMIHLCLVCPKADRKNLWSVSRVPVFTKFSPKTMDSSLRRF